jgi:hypothetical protein
VARTVVVRIPFEALRPLLAVVRQLLIVLQRHCPEVDRSIQTIGYVGVREHFLVEVADNAEKCRIGNDVYVILLRINMSVISHAYNPCNDSNGK